MHCIIIRTIGGDELAVQLHDNSINSSNWITYLKSSVAINWQVPAMCQELWCPHCNQVLSDSDVAYDSAYMDVAYTQHLIDDNAAGEIQMILSLVVSLDDVVRQLQSGDHQKARTALEALSEFGIKGGANALDAVVECLQNVEEGMGSYALWGIRERALEVLEHVTERGDDRALHVMGRLLRSHQSINVRHVAILGLVKVAATGDDRAIGLLLERFLLERTGSAGNKKGSSSRPCRLRKAAVRALGQIAKMNDKLIIVLLCRYREQRYLRSAATEALERILVEGDENAIVEEISPLMHPTVGVRREVALASVQTIQTEDEHIITYRRDDIMSLCRLLHWRHGWNHTLPVSDTAP